MLLRISAGERQQIMKFDHIRRASQYEHAEEIPILKIKASFNYYKCKIYVNYVCMFYFLL